MPVALMVLGCTGDFSALQPFLHPGCTNTLGWCSTPGLEDLLTAEEKAKLYTAIGYSGSSQSLALPKQVNKPVFMCV